MENTFMHAFHAKNADKITCPFLLFFGKGGHLSKNMIEGPHRHLMNSFCHPNKLLEKKNKDQIKEWRRLTDAQ